MKKIILSLIVGFTLILNAGTTPYIGDKSSLCMMTLDKQNKIDQNKSYNGKETILYFVKVMNLDKGVAELSTKADCCYSLKKKVYKARPRVLSASRPVSKVNKCKCVVPKGCYKQVWRTTPNNIQLQDWVNDKGESVSRLKIR